MEKWTELLKWVTDLVPKQARGTVAVLLIACGTLGWYTYDTTQEYKALFKEKSTLDSLRVNDTKECNARIELSIKEYKDQFQAYRDKNEAELRSLNSDMRRKLDQLYSKVNVVQEKSATIESKSQNIEEKLIK